MSTSDTNPKKQKSRYQRVKEILGEAAGDSTTDYQGYGRFWELPHEDFLKVEIYGVRMIAPAAKGSDGPTKWKSAAVGSTGGCCHSGGGGDPAASSAAARPRRGRGAESGLIKGLRAEFPFDGTHFPRLPWGGKEVSDADVRFIESWIDDGCPETDEPAATTTPPSEPHGDGHGGPVAPPNAFHHRHGQPKARKNYEYLSDEELGKLRAAVGALKKLDAYPADNRSFSAWARVHGDHCQHGWEQFLTWHRAYLYKFELALQRVDPEVTLPYWDWPMKIYNGGAVPQGKQSGVVPTALRCWLDESALKNLQDGGELPGSVLKKLGKVENQLFNSTWELFRQSGLSAADYKSYSQPVVAQLGEVNPLWHPRRYPGMYYETDGQGNPKVGSNGDPILAGSLLSQEFHHHYPRAEDDAQILGITNWHDFGGGHFANQSFGILEQNPHNTGHIWSGGQNPFWSSQAPSDPAEPMFGDMFNDLTAFFDPIGYAHHANIDRLYWQWQKLHPGLDPDNPTDELVPFDLRVARVLDVSKLGYEYARDSRAWQVDSGQELARYTTDPTDFKSGTLDGHRRVELRFHNLRRPVRSHTVRVFLNQPDADAGTPTAGNDHYVGYFARFGHGPCVGGPGHCDPPGEPVSRFEIRPRHHNTPHNHRLDATECVARLLAGGESDLRVSLVVADGNGGAAEGLKMDGVSIHVID